MDSAYCEVELPPLASEVGLQAVFGAPVEVLRAWRPEEVPALLERVETLAMAGHWLVGFVAYEAAGGFDAALVCHVGTPGLPMAQFAAFRADAPAEAPRRRHAFLCGHWRDALTWQDFDSALASIRRDIANGRFYQVNFTTRLRAPFLGDGAALFDALRASQPGAFSVFLDFGRWQICSVSPELFFHWSAPDAAGRRLVTRPMKGTAPRHGDPDLDRRAAEGLRASAKECAENLMIVDLLRNDLARIARLGSVAVPSLFAVEPWATVWQMTSTVECRTRPTIGLADVFGGLFPCGSVTGAPKAEAMKAITELEPATMGGRGAYCGAIGLVRPGGEACFNVGIRTVLVDTAAGMAECGIGSGIVIDSTSAGEYAEWQAKQRFLRRACPDFELVETLLWRRGRYWLRNRHLTRLAASAAALGFDCDGQRIEVALDQAGASFADGQWRVRLTLAANGAVAIDAQPIVRTRGPAACRLATQPVDSADPWLRHKTTRRSSYEALAVPGAFDTLLWNERGEATEFTRGNLVVRMGGRLLTPAVCSGLLPGTWRAELLARGAVREVVLTLGELRTAEALWFINSVRGAIPVTVAGIASRVGQHSNPSGAAFD